MKIWFYGVLPVEVPANQAAALLSGSTRRACIALDFGAATAERVNAVVQQYKGKRPEFTKTKIKNRKNKK